MIVAAMLALCAASAISAADPLEAGAARVDLTPPAALGASLGGYGDRMSRPAAGVHDRVWAKALVLRQGARRFALVTADVLGFPPAFKDAVVASLARDGWSAGDILMLPSHSHTSLDILAISPRNDLGSPQFGIFQPAVFGMARDRIAQVVRDAARAPAPVRVGWAQAALPGRIRNRRQGATLVDDTLTVLRIETMDARPVAALVNWTAHPTIMGSEDMLFSGDWPGHLQRGAEALIGGGVTVMFFNGAEGDQTTVRPEGGSKWEVAENYGLDIAAGVRRVWDRVRPASGVDAAWRVEPVALPARRWHPDFMASGGEEYGVTPANSGHTLEVLAPAATHSACLRIGDLLIAGVPGELTAGPGAQLRARAARAAGCRKAVIGGLADEWIGYILAPDEYRTGRYEASLSLYGETLAPVLMEGVVRAATACRSHPPRR